MKYTDPNTGKIYSSNRGWKIFAGIVTVLLVALIAFVAVYAVNHDLFDEPVESSENIEVIEKDDAEVLIYATECEDGTMRYDWRYVSGTCKVCYPPQEHGFTTGDCEGHTTYVDAYGFMSDYHPYRVSVTLSGKTASDTLDADIVFSSMPAKDDLYFNAKPVAVETKSTADVESVRILQNFRYETEKADADTTTQVMYDSIMDEVLAGGRGVFPVYNGSRYIDGEWYLTMEEWGFYYSGDVLREVSDDTAYILGNKETSSDEAAFVTRYGISSMTAYAGDAYEEHTYSSPSDATVRDGYYTLSVTMANGSVYAYDFYVDTDELQGSKFGFGYIESPLYNGLTRVWQDYGTGFENLYVYSKLNVMSERGDDPVTCDEYTGWVENEDVTAAGVSYTVADGINCECIYLENNAVWKGLNSAGLGGWGRYTDMYNGGVQKLVPNYYTTSHGVTYAYPAYRYDFYTYIVTEDFAGNIQVIDATIYGDITNVAIDDGGGFTDKYYGTMDHVWNPTHSTIGGVTYYDAKELIEAKEAVAIENRGGSIERYYKDVAYAYVNDWIVNGMSEYTVIDLPDKDYWCALVAGS